MYKLKQTRLKHGLEACYAVWQEMDPTYSTASRTWTILSHVNCFIRGAVNGFRVLLDSLYPRRTRAYRQSPPVLRSERHLASVFIWHSRNVIEQGNLTPCLDNSQKVWLPGCLSHFIILHMVVPFHFYGNALQ